MGRINVIVPTSRGQRWNRRGKKTFCWTEGDARRNGIYAGMVRRKRNWTLTDVPFYRVANSIFGKIGRIASEEVVIQLIKSKCIPALLYGLEACCLTNSDIRSLDFIMNRFFIKLFKTTDMNTVKECEDYFSVSLPRFLMIVIQTNMLQRVDICIMYLSV